jgi:AmmeMemoRadiSam system protein B
VSAATVRPAAVAGSFYPGSASSLATLVDALLQDARTVVGPRDGVRGVVAPHAGYVYSGPIAARAYAAVPTDRFERVVLLGPAHRVPLRGLAVPSVDAFETPLGDVPVARDAADALVERGLAVVDDAPHALEHSLEVHLPFLTRVLPRAPVLPVVVGWADSGRVAEAIDALWDDRTLVVVSTDLSHYETYESARAHDRATAAAIARADDEAIAVDDACGAHPLKGLLRAARARNLHVHEVDLRSSGDTAGSDDRVVGYGAFTLEVR